MTSIKTSLLALFLMAALVACQNTASKSGDATDTPADTENTEAPAPSEEKIMTLTAQFVEFSLGDAEHYLFKDKAGKTWDFGGCVDENVQFAEELPAEQADETNQGWGSNKKLQNKWFDLKYAIRQQPQYIDGPVGDVPVIIEAKMVE